jgi:uncharacterized protein YunC (DUF1805 family)
VRATPGGRAFAQDGPAGADGRITVMLGPQAPDMLPREQLLQVKRLAEREGLMIHMHVAQGDREINQMLKRYGQRTPAFLAELGYLDDQLLAVHLTEATDDEAALIARRGAGMALCSGSIGIIDGIVPPVYAFRRAGGKAALGSDQAAGNNCNNIFNEMKLTALFNKIKYRDPTVMPAWEVLRMATSEAAQAIGLGDEIGSLVAGKQADLIVVDLAAANLSPVLDAPVRNIVPNLVYAASGHEVQTVIIAGGVVVAGGGVLTADACGEAGLEVAALSPQTLSRIDKVLPSYWSHGNPVDMVAVISNQAYLDCLEIILADPNVDGVIALGANSEAHIATTLEAIQSLGAMSEAQVAEAKKAAEAEGMSFVTALKQMLAAADKPVLTVGRWVQNPEWENGMTMIEEPEEAASLMAKMAEYGQYRKRVMRAG